MSRNSYVVMPDGLILHTNGLPEVEARLLEGEAARVEEAAKVEAAKKAQVRAQQLEAARERQAARQAAREGKQALELLA